MAAEAQRAKMTEKVVEKMESQKGFVQIPARSRQELVGDVSLPLMTLVNGNPARLDKYGRIWSPFLKNKFNAGAHVRISRAKSGFLVELSKDECADVTAKTKEDKQPLA